MAARSKDVAAIPILVTMPAGITPPGGTGIFFHTLIMA